ncbi:hypothetical protein TEQG_00068 [Trichophyton equinum CBS 127.97]|uniref:Uncharacterized protein n=1 Tax=Trichophyton equinum (strain ATCC MYA-4606 / CBS 127.97) TaxID=559882 RepID=F2PGJ6_TRIEC|nr:hypothetical protein TEQG_00068 [Trichophyton equinum CBS 127.97]
MTRVARAKSKRRPYGVYASVAAGHGVRSRSQVRGKARQESPHIAASPLFATSISHIDIYDDYLRRKGVPERTQDKARLAVGDGYIHTLRECIYEQAELFQFERSTLIGLLSMDTG